MLYKLVPTTESFNKVETTESIKETPSYRITAVEALLACLSALAIFTVLLLRLPYRLPVTNTLLSTLALLSFYFYLRLRLNIRVPSGMILCLAFSLALDVIGNRHGLFSQRFGLFPYDIITHFAASGLSFVPVMWLVMKLIRRFGYRLPLGFVALLQSCHQKAMANR